MKFYICEHCGNLITFVHSAGVPVMCCGQKMTELVPGTTDAAVEKHVPVVKTEGSQVTVTVGEVEHPMLPEHFIEWIALETEQGQGGGGLRLLQPPWTLEGLILWKKAAPGRFLPGAAFFVKG